MKSLSNTLKNSYIKLIALFTAVLIILLIVTGKYLVDTSKSHLRSAMNFLTYEMKDQDSDTTLKIFTDNLISSEYKMENPILNDLDIIVQYEDNIYSENKSKNKSENILLTAKENKVKSFNFYKYLILSKNIENKDGDIFNVILVKNLSNEKTFFFNIIKIFMGGLFFTIVVSIIGMEHLLKKVSKQLVTLENINSNITLENLKILKPVNQFKEFDNIWNSYSQMIGRLDEQNRKHIDFIHSASHELKTPIFIISGYVDVIRRCGEKDKETCAKAISSIKYEIREMESLIEKLLFIAKDSNIKIDKKDIELSEIVISTITTLKVTYPEAKIRFKPTYKVINSDERLIKLLIKNILENAVKYGENKPIDIRVKMSSQNRVALEIEDYGVGMTPDELVHIYDRFYRTNKSRSKDISGHGLGMTMVKKILALLDIDIMIDSLPNKGTKVLLIF